MDELQVGLGSRSYTIKIAPGSLSSIAKEIPSVATASRYCIVTDDIVDPLYGQLLLESMKREGLTCDLLSFPHGEAHKNLATIGRLASGAAQLGLDRQSVFLALGGGVTGDVTGFLASAYMRGIPFIQIPTTLLAQVDSSVGGKTGVDIPEGKNLLGSFYQPLAVYIDTDVLHTLPEQEYLSGLAEVIKHGIIRDAKFFTFLKENRAKVMSLDPEVIAKIIYTNCKIKADIVAEDEREADIRRILNYGHTIGHAVEAASQFSLPHGFAVAIGMTAAARIAVLKSMLSEKKAQETIDLIKQYKLPTEIPKELDRKLIKSYLLSDKKNVGGQVFYILLTDNDGIIVTDEVSESQVDTVLNFA
jgi:3-dehydroquinate synthase